MSEIAQIRKNAQRYVWFTTLYNARAYYPILALLFLDLGLTLDQFVALNFVWAASIFFLEVPSGALADTLGRKTLLVAASVLMIGEMSCLLLAPKDGGWLLVALCGMNRFLSGMSEAAASGADEALAYDSLPEDEREDRWDDLLATAMRFKSVAFVIAMSLGGLLYDPTIVNQFLPEGAQLGKDLAHRLPVALVLLQGVACLMISLRMREPTEMVKKDFLKTCKKAVGLTLETAKWVFKNRATRVVIILGLGIDSVMRNFATINSSYYRLIEIPEWSFGFIGAAIGVTGYFVPGIAAKLNKRYGTYRNLFFASILGLFGIAGIAPAGGWWCLLPAAAIMMTLGYLRYTMSRALNRESSSEKRATVLSVKGLAFNLGYGAFSLAFSGLLTLFPESPEGIQLREALFWQIPFYALVVSGLLIWGKRVLAKVA